MEIEPPATNSFAIATIASGSNHQPMCAFNNHHWFSSFRRRKRGLNGSFLLPGFPTTQGAPIKRAIVSLLFGCVCCGVLAQSVDSFSIRLLPGVTIPLGETRDHHGVGASADLSMLYALPSAPFVRPSLDIGYSISRNSITDSNLSVISGAGGAELAVRPLERVILRAGGSAG